MAAHVHGSTSQMLPPTDTWAPAASNSPPVGGHRDPPAFDLAQLCVRDLYLQRQAGHPDGDLHLGGEVLVGEVHDGAHFALHLLPVHEDGIAGVGDLGREGENTETRRQEAHHTQTLTPADVHEPRQL